MEFTLRGIEKCFLHLACGIFVLEAELLYFLTLVADKP
jgi:hypothetical protein